jgi:predicted MFS family arabinose efflux permease
VLSLVFLVAGAGELVGNNFIPNLLRRFSAPRIYFACGIGYSLSLAAGGVGTDWLAAVFITSTLISIFSAAQYVAVNILLLDAMPHARGAAMSLGTAAMSIGGAIGVATAGFALDASGDYATAFRVLALSIPIGMLAILWSSRIRAASHPAAEAEPLDVVTAATEAGTVTSR